jgi:acylphosphatase
MMGNIITRHLTVTGRVQGVGYRYFMARTARDLRVTGWVRNRADGSVEAVICGTAEAVNAMIERARRGPAQAMVSECRVTEAHGNFTCFDTLPTA